MKIIKNLISIDKTEKYLIRTNWGDYIESAYIIVPYLRPQYVFCISTQVGCRVGCKFCASGSSGFVRNLKFDEMLSEVELLYSLIHSKNSFRVAFMGVGEPFHNYLNLVKTIKILSGSFSNVCKRISLSSIGIPRLITKFGEDTLDLPGINLQISINFCTDEKRRYYMPGTCKYSLIKTIEACQKYILITKKRIYFTYLLFDGINDSFHDAQNLAKILNILDNNYILKVSIYNPISQSNDLSPASVHKALWFKELLEKFGINVEIFQSMGKDISGGCGQMRVYHEISKISFK